MVDAEVKPSLPGNLPLPVAAGVIVDQLLFIWHPEQFSKLRTRLLKFVRVVVLFDVMILVELCDYPLEKKQKIDNYRDNKMLKLRNSVALLFF